MFHNETATVLGSRELEIKNLYLGVCIYVTVFLLGVCLGTFPQQVVQVRMAFSHVPLIVFGWG